MRKAFRIALVEPRRNGLAITCVELGDQLGGIETGLLRASQLTSGAPWRVEVSEEDRRRLTAAEAPKGWLPLKGAAQALGVTQQTVVNKLKCGELQGVRVCVGARTSRRICVDSIGCEGQGSLFD